MLHTVKNIRKGGDKSWNIRCSVASYSLARHTKWNIMHHIDYICVCVQIIIYIFKCIKRTWELMCTWKKPEILSNTGLKKCCYQTMTDRASLTQSTYFSVSCANPEHAATFKSLLAFKLWTPLFTDVPTAWMLSGMHLVNQAWLCTVHTKVSSDSLTGKAGKNVFIISFSFLLMCGPTRVAWKSSWWPENDFTSVKERLRIQFWIELWP